MTTSATFCTGCGSPLETQDRFCGGCGARVSDDDSVPPMSSVVPPTPPSPTPPVRDWSSGDPELPVRTEYQIVAVLLSIVAPFIALIAALILRANEKRPRRRALLSRWAIGSALWMIVWFVITAVVFSVAWSSVGGSFGGACRGGVDSLQPPSFTSQDGQHWDMINQCVDGGSTTAPAPAGAVPS